MKNGWIFFAAFCCFMAADNAWAQRAETKVTENYWYTSTTARNLEAGHEMLVTPLLADVKVQEVGRRVFGEDRYYYVEVGSTDTWKAQVIDELKRQALFDFIKEYEADVIVGALISAQTVDENKDGLVDREGNLYKVRITISGYPANYVNFRNAKQEDRWIKEQWLMRQADKNDAVTNSQAGTVARGKRTVVVD